MKTKRNHPVPGKDLYQCPGCSELVDNSDRSAVLDHHQHVLRPRASTFGLLPAVTILKAGR